MTSANRNWGTGAGGGGQPNVDIRMKIKSSSFFIVTWKYFICSINLIFEYSVPDKISLECKVYHTSPKFLNLVINLCNSGKFNNSFTQGRSNVRHLLGLHMMLSYLIFYNFKYTFNLFLSS